MMDPSTEPMRERWFTPLGSYLALCEVALAYGGHALGLALNFGPQQLQTMLARAHIDLKVGGKATRWEADSQAILATCVAEEARRASAEVPDCHAPMPVGTSPTPLPLSRATLLPAR
jgi:hypothetical protein